jgi:hypothetical protein
MNQTTVSFMPVSSLSFPVKETSGVKSHALKQLYPYRRLERDCCLVLDNFEKK